MRKKILHITPHLGGGVGKVLLEYLCNDTYNFNITISLDYINQEVKKLCDKNKINIIHSNNFEIINKEIMTADIVLIHFWNHPLLYNFLINNEFPPCRLIFWSHISGLYPPYVIPKKIIDMSDQFIFTSDISKLSSAYKLYSDKKKFSTILSTSDLSKFFKIKHLNHYGLNIGYVGTVDYSKIHKDFYNICSSIARPNINFYFIGSGNAYEELKNLRTKNIHFLGKKDNVLNYYSIFDIFYYPLCSENYGTAEQVIQEAMASGLPIVAMDNPCESSLIINNFNGLLSSNVADFKNNLIKLIKNRFLRKKLGSNSRKYAKTNFSIKREVNSWVEVFNNEINRDKVERVYDKKSGNYSPFELFLESIGKYSVFFSNPTMINDLKNILKNQKWHSKSKGTPFQYHAFFPDDKNLFFLCNLIQTIS